MNTDNWFIERSYYNAAMQGYQITALLHEENSKFQNIKVFETKALGKLLLLDDKTMVSELDEFVYHEIMAHVSMSVARNPKKALIIGGGDCGIVREFVKHPELEEIHLVEIDERVIEVSKKYFPGLTSGLSDKRVKVKPMDGIKYIKDHKNTFDIIIIDSTDPEDFAAGLFTEEFYKDVFNALTDNGIMMNQTENPFFDQYGIKKIYQNLKKSFPIVESLYAPMIIYPGVFWTFGFSSKKYKATDLNPDKKIFMNKLERNLKWYNQNWHQGAFKLSNFQKNKLGL